MSEARRLLDERLNVEFEELYEIEDEKERQDRISKLCDLYKLKLEEDKLDAEFKKMEYEAQKSSKEEELQKAKLKEASIDRWVQFGAHVGCTVLGIVAYDAWHKRGLRFEEHGSIGSPLNKNLISKMLPKI